MRGLGAETWAEREEQRKVKLVQVRGKDLRVGDHYEYRGVSTITRDATYEVEIKKITDYIVVMDILIDPTVSRIERYDPPRSYCIAIQRIDIGRTERLYRRMR